MACLVPPSPDNASLARPTKPSPPGNPLGNPRLAQPRTSAAPALLSTLAAACRLERRERLGAEPLPRPAGDAAPDAGGLYGSQGQLVVFLRPGSRPMGARGQPAVKIGVGLGQVLDGCAVRMLSAGRKGFAVAPDAANQLGGQAARTCLLQRRGLPAQEHIRWPPSRNPGARGCE